MGWTPRGSAPLITVAQARQLEPLLGRLDTDPCPVLAAAASLLANGATQVQVLRTARQPSLQGYLQGLALLAHAPAPLSLALPGELDPATLIAVARHMEKLPWQGQRAAEAAPAPLLWADLPRAEPEAALALRQQAPSLLIPVAPRVHSQPPGAVRALELPASALAQAAWCAAPQAVKGAHSLPRALPPEQRAALLEAGAAVLSQAPGRRVALRLELPQGVPWLNASVAPPTSAPLPDALEQALSQILAEERARGPEGLRGRLLRRWTAELERARRQGLLYGQSAAQAYRVAEVAPGEFEVWIARAPRSPSRLILRSHHSDRR